MRNKGRDSRSQHLKKKERKNTCAMRRGGGGGGSLRTALKRNLWSCKGEKGEKKKKGMCALVRKGAEAPLEGGGGAGPILGRRGEKGKGKGKGPTSFPRRKKAGSWLPFSKEEGKKKKKMTGVSSERGERESDGSVGERICRGKGKEEREDRNPLEPGSRGRISQRYRGRVSPLNAGGGIKKHPKLLGTTHRKRGGPKPPVNYREGNNPLLKKKKKKKEKKRGRKKHVFPRWGKERGGTTQPASIHRQEEEKEKKETWAHSHGKEEEEKPPSPSSKNPLSPSRRKGGRKERGTQTSHPHHHTKKEKGKKETKLLSVGNGDPRESKTGIDCRGVEGERGERKGERHVTSSSAKTSGPS